MPSVKKKKPTPNADQIIGNIFRDLKLDKNPPQFKAVPHSVPKKEFRPNSK